MPPLKRTGRGADQLLSAHAAGTAAGTAGRITMEATVSPTVATEPAWTAEDEGSLSRYARGERPLDRSRIRSLTLAALGTLALLNLADVLTTRMLLTHRGASEANPLASVLLGNGTILWVKLFCLTALALSVVRRRQPRVGTMLGAWVAVGLYGAAVLSNVLILRLLAGG